jgi:outer membrane protein assembly factor BamB
VIVKGLAIGGMDNGKLVALDIKTGKVAWETSVTTAHGRTDLERMVDIDGDLLVMDDTLYLATYHGRLAAVGVDGGEIRWTHDLSSYSGIAIEGERIYATDDQSHVIAFDRSNGNVIWKNEQLDARSATAPGVAGNYIVIGDLQGYLHWLRKSDGSYQGRGRIDKSPIYASPLAAQNLVLGYSSSGYLAAFKGR